MLSAHTRDGANTTLDAMAMGAMDFIDKSGLNVMDFDRLSRELLRKLEACRAARGVQVGTARPGPRPPRRRRLPPCARARKPLPAAVDWRQPTTSA